ncbi:hypothetical protein SAMN02745751_02694 [Dethiosulfatibacter aminovorans DSM 17477]|uniref:Uncharacterized protein n=1 Tax=Dethiosulfatibacter aminovorans DSM 17477 TaxID=1121476 RepID=A0A1M6JQQ6_9FIRM|nr:hypothetical protein [Dethiosulfatibacter aminovorans]SHJ48943.1 hypothetical protein SAMN02745751_02694 [Dethiosulfatibacter aminovorans DSM 17477]
MMLFAPIIIFGILSFIISSISKKKKLLKQVNNFMNVLDLMNDDLLSDLENRLSTLKGKRMRSLLKAYQEVGIKSSDMKGDIQDFLEQLYLEITTIQLEGDIKFFELLNEETQQKVLKKLGSKKGLFVSSVESLKDIGLIKHKLLMKMIKAKVNVKISEALIIYKKEMLKFSQAMNDLNLDSFIDTMDNTDFDSYSELFNMQMINDMMQQQMTNQMISDMNQSMQICMDAALRSITPMDFGGHMGGVGFNPSETMHHDMNQMMNSMNDMGMNNMHNMGMNDMNNNNGMGF